MKKFLLILLLAPLFLMGQWIQKPTNPYPSSKEFGGFAYNGKIYQIGGECGPSLYPRVYDISSNTWAGIATPQKFLMHHLQAAQDPDKPENVYVASFWSTPCATGGVTNDSIYKIHIPTWTWTGITKVPATRKRGAAAVVVVDGKIWIIGGSSLGHNAPGTAVGWTDVYDPIHGVWSVRAPATLGVDHCKAFHHDGKIYVAGGSDGSSRVRSEIQAFDIKSGSWSIVGNMPSPVMSYGLVVHDGRAYYIGGLQTGSYNNPSNGTFIYNVDIGNWSFRSSLISARGGIQPVLYEGRMYAWGGRFNAVGGVEDYIEVYTVDPKADLPHATSAAEIQVYPTTFTDEITVSASGRHSIKIVSTKGQLLYRAIKGGDQYKVSLNLPAGIYYLRIRMDDGRVVAKKIIKI